MSVSWTGRLRDLFRVVFDYFAGWRGVLFALAAVASALIAWAYSGSLETALVVFSIVGLLLIAIGVLLANQDRWAKYGSSSAGLAEPEPPATPPDPVEADADQLTLGATYEPLAAIVVVSRNDSPYIEAAIRSVQAQTLESFECIVVDDLSTDDTVDRILSLVGLDPRFRVLQNTESAGAAASRDAGLAEVRAPYVTFLDGDSFLYEDSLRARLEQVMQHADEPWVAGTYCQWISVPELATPGGPPTATAVLPAVTWLSSLADAPFITAAPLVRTDALRSIGGFSASRVAPDELTWNRMLRAGYVFSPLDVIGVARRARRAPAARRAAIEDAGLVSESLAENARPAAGLPGACPYPFSDPCTAYVWEMTRVRRLIGALANAVESRDADASERVAADVVASLEAYQIWQLPLDDVIRSQALRACRYLEGPDLSARVARVETEVANRLESRVRELLDEVRSRTSLLPVDASGESAVRRRALALPNRLHVGADLLDQPGSLIDGRVILMPSATYHVDETGPISEELATLGIESVVMVSDYRWPLVAGPQAAYRVPALASIEAGRWLGRAAGLVVMNDWGDEHEGYVKMANALDVPTFGMVEGVQDFDDDDVPWDRNAYRSVRWVLAQGQNDVDALPMQDTLMVSGNRLETIWGDPPRAPGAPLAVINVNFTYDVLDDARDMWLESAVAACREVGIPFIISLHPAERDRYSSVYPVATVPIRHLLTEASVLISRFSTVPFEAMARGVPFIYHNPHGEQVPTFATPNGAFDITTSTPELVAALRATEQWQVGYRDRAAEFFLRQIDVSVDTPAPQRAAREIAARLKRA